MADSSWRIIRASTQEKSRKRVGARFSFGRFSHSAGAGHVGPSGSLNAQRSTLNAFTLVELLVVIAIVMVIAAILFPLFRSAKAAARKTQCLSNLRQSAQSAQMYADDNNSRYVPAAPDIFSAGG